MATKRSVERSRRAAILFTFTPSFRLFAPSLPNALLKLSSSDSACTARIDPIASAALAASAPSRCRCLRETVPISRLSLLDDRKKNGAGASATSARSQRSHSMTPTMLTRTSVLPSQRQRRRHDDVAQHSGVADDTQQEIAAARARVERQRQALHVAVQRVAKLRAHPVARKREADGAAVRGERAKTGEQHYRGGRDRQQRAGAERLHDALCGLIVPPEAAPITRSKTNFSGHGSMTRSTTPAPSAARDPAITGASRQRYGRKRRIMRHAPAGGAARFRARPSSRRTPPRAVRP
jgi:hypothetical protein